MIRNVHVSSLNAPLLLAFGILLFSCNTDAKQPKAGPTQEIMGGTSYAPVDSSQPLPDSIIRKGVYYNESYVVDDEIMDEPPIDSPAPVIIQPDIVDTTPVVTEDFSHDELPEFPGGQAAFRQYISNNVRYPQHARDEGLSGKVFVSFKITETGKIDSVQLLRGFNDSCDLEALRVIREMPDWTPAKRDGKPISVKFNVPIIFKMQ